MNTKMSFLAAPGLDFPLVTVCTYARLNASKIDEMGIDTDLQQYLLAAFKVA